MLSYEISAEGDGYLFKMAGKSDGYLAVGLSPDNDKMGDDLTTACYYDQSGQVRYLKSFFVSCFSIFPNFEFFILLPIPSAKSKYFDFVPKFWTSFKVYKCVQIFYGQICKLILYNLSYF